MTHPLLDSFKGVVLKGKSSTKLVALMVNTGCS